VGILAVNITHCFYPPIIAAKELIESGKLGTIIKVEDTMIFPIKESVLNPWYFQKEITGGGVAITNVIHMLSRINYLFDQAPTFINGQAFQLYQWGDIEDTALMQLKLNDDIAVHLHASWPRCEVESKFIEEMKVYGSKGILKVQAWEGYEFTSYDNENLSYKPYDSKSNLEERTQLGMNNVLANFIQGVLTKKKNIKMLENVLCAQQIIGVFYKETTPFLEQQNTPLHTFFK
jgi:predicted dehydrogenase